MIGKKKGSTEFRVRLSVAVFFEVAFDDVQLCVH